MSSVSIWFSLSHVCIFCATNSDLLSLLMWRVILYMVMACDRVINTCFDWIWRSAQMAKPHRGPSAVEETLYSAIVTVDLS